ncbi:HD family phosphohydrolase [Planctomycetales bacterium]|nr:HD family phosphohydrolase [Planctomycetales bacterium]GHT05965.1 HD family phosphohydrolase [Planctomycetales bacterium]
MRRAINEFTDGELVAGFYALREASLSVAKNGKPYLRLSLGDATGAIGGNLWDAPKNILTTLTVGGAVKISGMVESYRDQLQLRVEKIRAARAGEVNPADFLPVSSADLPALEQEIFAAVAALADRDYRALLDAFFTDKNFCAQFFRAPAARAFHHACVGGLLEHTATILRYGRAILAQNAVRLNADLLTAGIILHDVGKIEELALGASIEYSDRGKLLGHISIGNLMVEERAATLPHFPPLKKYLLQHLILSHHGQMEYGSPVLPAVPEAFALHHLDNLDAKTVAAARLIGEDNGNSRWTPKSFMLATALFKGGAANSETANGEAGENPAKEIAPAAEPAGAAADNLFA